MNRPRGLCWGCYYTPGVKDLYALGSHNPETAKYANRGLGNEFRRSRPLPEPTDYLPGTPEKLEILKARELAGEALWHPLDATREKRRPTAPTPGTVRLSGEAMLDEENATL